MQTLLDADTPADLILLADSHLGFRIAAMNESADDVTLLREMLDHMDQGVVLYDRDSDGEETVRLFNTKAAALLELPEGFIRRGLRRREIINFCQARGDHAAQPDSGEYFRRVGHHEKAQILTQRPSGRWVQSISHPRTGGQGSLTLHIDVSEHVAREVGIEQGRREYEALVETAPTGILKIDASGRTTFANTAVRDIFDAPDGEIEIHERLVPSDGRSLAWHLEHGGRFEAEVRIPYATRHVFASVSGAIGSAGSHSRIIAIADITALKEARSQIEHMAKHDPLTGLGNRSLFNLVWSTIDQTPPLLRSPTHLIALDLDHFKAVNDEYGHGVGDKLLSKVATRIMQAAGVGSAGFRLGGDEFAVLLRGGNRNAAMATAKRIVRQLSAPFDVSGAMVCIGCSAGVASLPLNGSSGEEIQRAADVALYQVKRNGRNGVACFDPEQERAMTERRRLQADLTLAIANGGFHLVFQPEVELQTGRTVGVEALLRWHNKRLGRLVPPSDFIPLAESCGLISLIDLWVIKAATAQIRVFMNEGLERPLMSINLSPITLARLEVVRWLTDALRVNGVPPEMLEIEITEGVAIVEKDRIVRTLTAIREAGIRIAIDDFGAGHTSLAYIQALPVDRVKIDRSIIGGIGKDDSTRAIVASIWDLCGRLGLKLTAEGIETAEQWEELKALGALDGQGYYLGMPESSDIVLERLRSEGQVVAAPTTATNAR